jgi:dihydroorotate dehydrogenase (NAD+) catalytic subunit
VDCDLSVKIGKLKLNNPVMVASGTFGYGEEFKDLVCLKDIGAIVTKSVTLKAYEGNNPPRICETTAGMLNAIGLQNEGIDDFIKNKLPFLKNTGTVIIASIAGKTKQEYVELTRLLNKTAIDGVEVNISCPNAIWHKRSSGPKNMRLFSQDAKATKELIGAVRKNTKKTLITKLSPNVTDIVEIAKAASEAGTDALSLINTVLGMEVDIVTKRPKLGNITGGLSGPAIKPIALRMVWEVYKNVEIPIIGIGGIMDTADAIEFFICGATAIQVGTVNFIYPDASIKIIEGLRAYSKDQGLKTIKELIGTLKE